MITVIRRSLVSLLFYWKKPVTDRPGQSGQNDRFIVVNGTQYWFILSSKNYQYWLQCKNSRLNTAPHTPGIIQIPIVFPYAEIPCLHPAVSSLGACPTPAR